MNSEKFSNIIKSVPLANNTVSRPIHEMSMVIESDVTEHVKSNGCCVLLLGKTLDVAGLAILLAFTHVTQLQMNSCFASP